MLTALRNKQRRLTPRLLAALGVVWLNMVLNPCAMALGEPDEPDCPHCPPVQHCDEQISESCRFIDSIDSDGRTHQTQVPDFSDYAYALPPVPAPVANLAIDVSAITSFLLTTGPPGPRLHIRYCVYLD